MGYLVTPCRKGGYKAVMSWEYDDVMDYLREKEGVEILSETPHLSMIRFQGQKMSVNPGKIMLRTEDGDKAEELAADLLDDYED